MNRTLGSSAGLLALIVFLIHIAAPTAQEGRSADANTSAAKAMKSGAAQTKSEAEPAPEGPWLATRHFFAAQSDPAAPRIDFTGVEQIVACSTNPACSASLRGFFGLAPANHPEFLLATVPDPLHTRLSLFTDSSLDAIQKAANEAGWFFATQWMPWSDTVDPDEKDPTKRSEEREYIRNREKQPGVLVFRRKIADPRVLIVFIVGETPTAGVNPEQFQVARAYMRAIANPAIVRIQGPTFSGALYSMHKLLEQDQPTLPPDGSYLVRGVASDYLEDWELGRAWGFRGTNSPDDFPQVLEALNIPRNEAAMLVEDETDYGASVATSGIRVYRFPREISHLRNAYRDVAQSSKQKDTGAPLPELEFSLKDSETGEDSIPTFSAAKSPLAQSAVVSEITGAIRRDQLRIVEITATNVLDRLFLAQILKRECPDTRLVIPFPDLLFIEQAQSSALAGTLAIANYPLFVRAGEWTGRPAAPLSFPDANSQAVYNATSLLLEQGRPDSVRSRHLFAYSRPGVTPPTSHPPMWLMMIDRQGFSPVRLLPVERNIFEDVPNADMLRLTLPSRSAAWTIFAALVGLLAVLIYGWMIVLRLNRAPTLGASLELRGLPPAADRWRLFYISAAALAITAVQWVLSSPFWINGDFRPRTGILIGCGVLLGLGVGICGLLGLLSAPIQTGGRFGLRVASASGILLAFGSFVVLWARCYRGVNQNEGFFFLYRVAELRLGSSPAWPVLAALTILIAFFLFQVNRLYLAAREAPEIMIDGFETALQPRIQEACERFNGSVEAPLGLSRRGQLLPVLFAVIAFCVIFWATRIDIQLSTIDGRSYDALSITLILLAGVCLVVGACQVLNLWQALQQLLNCLDTLPFGVSFTRADYSSSDRPLWVRRLNLQSIDVHAAALKVLHDMVILAPNWFIGRRMLSRYIAAVARMAETRPGPTRAQVWEIQRLIRRISTFTSRRVFQGAWEYWQVNRYYQLAEPQPSDPASPGKTDASPAGAELPVLCLLAHRFIAFHYSSYLTYGVRQIRNLLLFLPVGFVLLVFAMNSYSHQSPQFIGRMLLLIAVPLGVVVWVCLSGMERDPILSRVAGTKPGEVGIATYLKFLGYGALPILGLLASQFPAISNFLYSWVAPTLQAAK